MCRGLLDRVLCGALDERADKACQRVAVFGLLDGRIDLISDNRAYDPETLDAAALQQLRVIGRVYAAVSKF